jgi:hypothetical protein
VNHPSPHKEVRYVVCRLGDPGDLEGEREKIGWHQELGFAMSHADRTGPGTCVDAEGGTYYPSGPCGQHSRWEVEWVNRDVYEGRGRKTAS